MEKSNLEPDAREVQLPVVAVVGLGRMGSGIAKNLVAKGYRVLGTDPVVSQSEALKRLGGEPVSAGAVALEAKVVIFSLPDTAALANAVEAITRSRSGSGPLVILETSTLPVEAKLRAKNILNEAGIEMLDCALIGGGMQAQEGSLTLLCSGDEAQFIRLMPILRSFSSVQQYVGNFGEAMRMKLVVNYLVNITNVVVAETLQIAKQAGLDLALVNRIIGGGPAGSGIWRARVPLMVDAAYDDTARQSAQMTVPLKDNAIIADFVKHLNVATPLFTASLGVYESARTQGREKQDPAALLAVLEQLAKEA